MFGTLCVSVLISPFAQWLFPSVVLLDFFIFLGLWLLGAFVQDLSLLLISYSERIFGQFVLAIQDRMTVCVESVFDVSGFPDKHLVCWVILFAPSLALEAVLVEDACLDACSIWCSRVGRMESVYPVLWHLQARQIHNKWIINPKVQGHANEQKRELKWHYSTPVNNTKSQATESSALWALHCIVINKLMEKREGEKQKRSKPPSSSRLCWGTDLPTYQPTSPLKNPLL